METTIINDMKYFIYNKEEESQIDIVALRMLERNDITGLLSFKYIQQERKVYFRYNAGKEETLEEWLARVQSRKDVIKLLISLAAISREAEEYLLEPAQICTDIRFITVCDNQCKAACIPLKGEVQGDILQLIRKVIGFVKYAMDEDFTYLFDLQNAFGRGDIQNFIDLKKWIRIVNGEEERIPDSNSQETMKQTIPDTEAKSNSLEDIWEGLGQEKRGLFFKSKKKSRGKTGEMMEKEPENPKPAVQKMNMPEREIINDLERGDLTVMMATSSQPVLIRGKNGMQYELSGDSCVIGSGAQADIVIADNPTVSRKHARIFVNGGDYYIEDLGSTNGTCVNGEMLREREPYKLEDRARIQCSDEGYFFEMRG